MVYFFSFREHRRNQERPAEHDKKPAHVRCDAHIHQPGKLFCQHINEQQQIWIRRFFVVTATAPNDAVTLVV